MSSPSARMATALILAAGTGRRFGDVKPLAILDGRPIVAHVIQAAHSADLDALVVSPPDPRVIDAATAAGAGVVRNGDPSAGMARSLRLGLADLPLEADAAVVLLGDQPMVDPDVIRALVAAWRSDPDRPWQSDYADGPGHPVVLPRLIWPHIQRLRGDVGARSLLVPLGVRTLPVAGSRPLDVDTPEDLLVLRTADAGRPEPDPDLRGA